MAAASVLKVMQEPASLRGAGDDLVPEAGGSCRLCANDRCLGALHFHPLAPEDKLLPVSMAGVTLGIDFLRAEACKCVLLCSNCHAEVEAQITRLSVS
jgi:hypothetical protein